jgi:hypothetical protein
VVNLAAPREKCYLQNRVTGFGEFSSIGWLFIMRSFFDDRCSQNYWANFFHGKNYVLYVTEIALGYILGDFFTNSSSHTATEPQQDKKTPRLNTIQ